tara:strand:+ start:7633 stop:8127 length:495 start_codon:yes stop_codon:yes gene_type:complete
MDNRGIFRIWFYFRTGWSTYFAFILAAINTLTVTYFLAIDNYPSLKNIFPSFEIYILIVSIIGIPILTAIGYSHFKRTPGLRSESDVLQRENPYWARMLINSQFSLTLNLKILNLITKLSKNEKISDNEINELSELQKQFQEHIDTRTLSNKKDKDLFISTEKS